LSYGAAVREVRGAPMKEDTGFLKAILASPADDVPRLVYADWLDDRGDPRGEYLRTELALARLSRRSRKAKDLRFRLQELPRSIKPSWLAVFDQPAVMRANPTPFPAGWWSIDLEGVREMGGTYGLFPYESLPPLPVGTFRGDFGWLRGSSRRAAAKARRNNKPDSVARAAAALGLKMPREYGVFMRSVALRRRVRSSTDCFFNWPKWIAASPGDEGGHLVRFYSDSQSCCHWYLYLTTRGYSCVVSSGAFIGGHAGDPAYADWGDEDGEVFFCGSSFEEFIYRTWIENESWFALVDHDRPLTPEEQAYLAHYQKA
jgi:uncharacterized protein (TIGR02996 family)